MSYYLARTLPLAFDEAVNRVTTALKEKGFGVLTDIDVQATSVAREVGATLRRTASLNTSPTFIAALEDLVRHATA